MERLWKVNPIGSIMLQNSKPQETIKVWDNCNYYGFVDGSWKSTSNSPTESGIGGCLLDLEGNIIFIFLGPTNASSPLEAEKQALTFLYSHTSANQSLKGYFTFYSDSKYLQESFLKERSGIIEEELFESCKEWKSLILNSLYKIKFLSREKLVGANKLAKEGRETPSMIYACC